MSCKLILSLTLTFLCGNIIGQNISGTIINESNQPIDSLSNKSNIINRRLELAEIGMVNKGSISPTSLMFPNTLSLENSFSYDDYRHIPYLNVVSRPKKVKPFYHSRITPFNYNSENMVAGLDLVGFNISLISTPVIDLFVSPRVSSFYMGHLFPTRINNASLQTNFLINAGDYIRFKLVGQISANEGINPLLNPMAGASNYYGGAVQVRIVGDLGIEASVQRNFFLGEWSTSYHLTPINF